MQKKVDNTVTYYARQKFNYFLSAMRIHQWVKNFLLYIPLTMAHQITDLDLLLSTTIGFFAFCLCASGVYVINDLMDLAEDRKHVTKKNRPFALVI